MSMKLILKNEVHNLGLPGDVVTVADGYGRNYLIPQGFAIRASKGAMTEAEAMTRSRLAVEARTLGDAQKQADLIAQRPLQIKARVDQSGHLYGSVSVGDLQKALKERGFAVDKRRIELKGAIKSIGEYSIPVQVHPQVTATLTIDVVDVDGVIGVAVVEPVAAEENLDATEAVDGESLETSAVEAANAIEAAEVAAEASADAPAEA
jgi:large subunit ribosomal protein L9